MKYVPTIGLEIHAHLKTKTKLFCDSLNDPFNAQPNVNICAVCMGHPGVLPVINKKAIDKILQVGLALNCQIADHSKFDRKNYFYPDLPKGYQISQYDMPFCENGYIDISVEGKRGEEYKRIEIERIHLEEDAGKLVHSQDGMETYVDFNRAGVPLMELVTRPVINSALEVRKFAQELRLVLRYLDVSDADMEKGQMRVEVNISLASEDSKKLGTKVELKNLNSLRVVEAATVYEIQRQTELLEAGEKVIQETRGWDENKQQTFSQRSKEEAHDYRYFPEPDLPPVTVTKENGFDLDRILKEMPELPQAKRNRFMAEYGHNLQDAGVLVEEKQLADYFEGAVSEALNWAWSEDSTQDENDKEIENKIKTLTTNYTIKNLRTLLSVNRNSVKELKITHENFGELMHLIQKGDLSSAGARDVLEEMFNTGKDPSNIIEEKGLKQVSGEGELEGVVNAVINANSDAADDYHKGKESALKFLVGQVMIYSKGSANPHTAQELL